MKPLQIKDIEMNYGVIGEGRPVLFLHGNPADHRSMMSAFEPIFLNRSGWQRHYLDLPGMGKTKGADWIKSNDDMLSFVMDFIDTVLSNQKFTIVGESYGGYLARGLAYRLPDMINGMFLLSPLVKPNLSERQRPQKNIIHVDKDYVESLPVEMQQALGEATTVHNREVAEQLLKDYIPAMELSDQTFLGRLRERYEFSFDLNHPSLQYDFPTLIISGKQDIIVGYADQLDLHRFFTRATVAVLDRAGHVSELEQPKLFQELTNEWLNRVEEYTLNHPQEETLHATN